MPFFLSINGWLLGVVKFRKNSIWDKQYYLYFIIVFYPDDQQKNVVFFSLEVQDLNINELF